MPNQLPPSIFPARFQILSGSMLKLLACIAMLIDHTGAIILSHYPPALTELFYCPRYRTMCFSYFLFPDRRRIPSYA